MSWIESHQQIEKHPKTLQLSSILGVSLNETIGILHRFWWFCLEYAPTGCLHKFNDSVISQSVGLNASQGKVFVDAMVISGWIDRKQNVFRVHDWVEYAGRYLRDSKFKRTPNKWQEVLNVYNDSFYCVTELSADCSKTVTEQSAVPPPTIPTITNHNQTTSAGLDFNIGFGLEKRLVELGLKPGISSKYRHDDITEVLRLYDMKIKKGETFKNPQGWILSELKKLDTSDIAEDKITAMIEILKTGEAYTRGNCPPPGKTLRQYVIEKLRRNGKKD